MRSTLYDAIISDVPDIRVCFIRFRFIRRSKFVNVDLHVWLFAFETFRNARGNIVAKLRKPFFFLRWTIFFTLHRIFMRAKYFCRMFYRTFYRIICLMSYLISNVGLLKFIKGSRGILSFFFSDSFDNFVDAQIFQHDSRICIYIYIYIYFLFLKCCFHCAKVNRDPLRTCECKSDIYIPVKEFTSSLSSSRESPRRHTFISYLLYFCVLSRAILIN